METMMKGPFYPEETLVAKHQAGEYNWLDYVTHHSEEWCEEYEEFCKKNNFDTQDVTAAELFLEYKNELLENSEA